MFAAALLAVGAVAGWGWLRTASPDPVLRYELPMVQVANAAGIVTDLPAPVSAPDGSFLVYAAARADGGGVQLHRKRREEASGTPIEGSEDALSFTLSPDGRSIGFTASSQLRTVPVTGGVPDTLVSSGVYGPGGVAWRDDGTLVYASSRGGLPELRRVSRDGSGDTSLVVNPSGAAVLPVAAAGTSLVFFGQCASPTSCELWVIDLDDGETRQVVRGVSFSAWSPTGHLLYVQSGRLMVTAFDTKAMESVGEPVALITGVSDGILPIHVSTAGTLSLKMGGSALVKSFDLVWVDRTGAVTPLDTAWHVQLTAGSGNVGWSLSPDGTRLAIGLNTESGDDIWIRALPDGPLTRPSPGTGPNMRPRWTADGQAVTIVRQGNGPAVAMRRADGTGRDSILLAGLVDEAMLSPDGSWLLVRDGASGSVRGGRNIRGRRLNADTALVPLVATRFDEEAIALSPDGRWLAYQSDESGRNEVFVRPFPQTDAAKRQVSRGGGTSPLWSRDGRELFFLSAEREMLSARVTQAGAADTPIEFARPTVLFRVPDELLGYEYAFYTPWDVAPDGRFLMARNRPDSDDAPSRIVIAEHWLAELQEKLADARR